jgi:small ubiquitin-related modifier
MNAYCDRQSVEFNSIAFLFDGRRLRGEQTPDEVSFSHNMLMHTVAHS